jgi:hypothetical protein
MNELLLAVFTASALFLAPQTPQGQSRPASQPGSRPGVAAAPTATEGGKVYDVFGAGVAIKAKEAVPVADLVKNIKDHDGKTLRVEGKVESVCPKKGCWTWIAGADNARTFVRFKDYGFFLPKDCAGREIVLEGVAQKKTLSVDEARHYAEDRGDFEGAKKITEPQEITFVMASGVHLLRKEPAKK